MKSTRILAFILAGLWSAEAQTAIMTGPGGSTAEPASVHATYEALDHEGGREVGKLDTTIGGFGLAGRIHFWCAPAVDRSHSRSRSS